MPQRADRREAVVKDSGVAEATIRDIFVTILTSTVPPSRKQVAERLRLSRAAVTKAVSFLLDAGYVQELGERDSSGPGRRHTPLAIQPSRRYVLGISIQEAGRLTGVVTDLSATPVARDTGKFDRDFSAPDDVVDAIADLAEGLTSQVRDRSRILGIGLALGGQIDSRTGTVKRSWNFDPPWREFPLADYVAKHTELDVAVENDANALALYEQWYGIGRDQDDFATVLVSDQGVGFGCVADGRLLHGHEGLNGELGHVEVQPDTRQCRCERTGCLEVLVADSIEALRVAPTSKKTLELVRRTGHAMGRVIATLQLTNASSRILVCGDGLTRNSNFRDALHKAFDSRPFLESAARVLEWRELTQEIVACGAASMLIRSLPFDAN
jgi:predicted NBD/HSP70 family sugar kinase